MRNSQKDKQGDKGRKQPARIYCYQAARALGSDLAMQTIQVAHRRHDNKSDLCVVTCKHGCKPSSANGGKR